MAKGAVIMSWEGVVFLLVAGGLVLSWIMIIWWVYKHLTIMTRGYQDDDHS